MINNSAILAVILLPLLWCAGSNAEQPSAIQQQAEGENRSGINNLHIEAPSRTRRYTVHDANAQQALLVQFQGPNTIAFTLKLEGGCRRELRGEAVSSNLDYEIDEDESGLAYPTEEFVYKSGDDYYLSIRIAANERDKVRIKESAALSCPFLNGLMR